MCTYNNIFHLLDTRASYSTVCIVRASVCNEKRKKKDQEKTRVGIRIIF